ncbi:hypothetical protein ACOSQ2_017211 [Xanthoceras sorbifolium]
MTFRNVEDEGNASGSRGRANSEPPRNQQGRYGFRNWEEDEVGRDLWKGLYRDEIPTPILMGQVENVINFEQINNNKIILYVGPHFVMVGNLREGGGLNNEVDTNKNNQIGIGPSIGPKQVDAMGDNLMEAKEGFGLVDTEVGQVDAIGFQKRAPKKGKYAARSPNQRRMTNLPSSIKKFLTNHSKNRSSSKSPKQVSLVGSINGTRYPMKSMLVHIQKSKSTMDILDRASNFLHEFHNTLSSLSAKVSKPV